MAQSNLVLRTLRREDLNGILELYNSARAEAPHFARDSRFLEYFTQCQSAEDGIFIASEAEKIAGLAIVCITEEGDFKQGRVVELQAKDAATMTALIQTAQDYCYKKDVDMIVVVPPPSVKAGNTFKGWLKFETGAMMSKSLNILSLLEALLDKAELKRSLAGKKFKFNIGDEEIAVKIDSQAVEVAVFDGKAADTSLISLAMSPQVFLGLTLRGLSPLKAWVAGKIKTGKAKDVPVVLRLLGTMKLKQPWSLMLVDRV